LGRTAVRVLVRALDLVEVLAAVLESGESQAEVQAEVQAAVLESGESQAEEQVRVLVRGGELLQVG
jgi:hypothetical protein